MCGIVGYAGFEKKILLDKATDMIKHRGPDDSGHAYFNGAALGNRRLAIIDLSPKGHQPMFTFDKSLCITYNGEIYNFKDIKKKLEKKYKFASNSDTETILYAYQEWGVKCVEKLHGMFAFVIYDAKRNLLFGARDRLGQKPLKYYFENGRFIFGSEIKAILPLVNEKLEIDAMAIDNFLTLQYVPSPKTGFKKMYKLPPGHFFIYKNRKLSVKKYWSLNFHKKLDLSYDDWQTLIFSELKRSVESHLISDVPVGALLSGGLDSSIIVALMSLNSSRSINTFSIGFDDKRFDETPYARIVSELYKTRHTELMLTANELMKHIPDVATVFDEPIGDNSIIPMLLVSKLARKKVTVALTGDGGDENFSGYDRYTIVAIARYLSQSPQLGKNLFRFGAKAIFKAHPNKQTERMKRFFSSLDDAFYRRYMNYNMFFTSDVKHMLYTPDFKKAVGKNDTYEQYNSICDPRLSDLDNALNIDTRTYLPDDLLYKSDSASMANSLELRAPFLDHIFMEKIAAMPSEIKLRLLTKKKILKKIAQKQNLLPKEIIYRRKQGFTIPQNKWFKGPLKKYLYEKILSSNMTDQIFEKRKLEEYLDAYYQTDVGYDNNIFALLMLSLWLERYF